ncbi:recombination associated protein RdgC [Pasteurella testudinis DSM 23072]|uniref:Recombination-associated protein RdgC n=1 Tax=Pasteurella testudinis DSM 23072 TaxID=1122938 RepID=A0A1W1V357_9PAST|nr:recombination-associated protein RdgC [Pasteurella testudinis]SMB87817.1 recombination associated protein RdgC [Pasteurella testudinis DSM 23072]SUB51588.1 recombination-associated protein rdgC [Pasteurella testudinis]
MYWFKNAIIYRIKKELDWSNLQPRLAQEAFTPCASFDASKFGWIEPLDSESLHHSANGFILLVAQREEKILPAHVINKELKQRVDSLEEKEQRKLSKVEKQSIKDDVVAMLLQRAFSKFKQTALLIDTKQRLIYVDAASTKQAEDVLSLLRKTLGSLPVVPLAFANNPSALMTDWVKNDSMPDWLTLLDEAELTSTTDDAVIRCKRQDLESEEMEQHYGAGKSITKLALYWEDHLNFVLTQDCALKRLKFADNIREQNDDILKEDYSQRFDADFILMTSELSQLFDLLSNEFGVEKEIEWEIVNKN